MGEGQIYSLIGSQLRGIPVHSLRSPSDLPNISSQNSRMAHYYSTIGNSKLCEWAEMGSGEVKTSEVNEMTASASWFYHRAAKWHMGVIIQRVHKGWGRGNVRWRSQTSRVGADLYFRIIVPLYLTHCHLNQGGLATLRHACLSCVSYWSAVREVRGRSSGWLVIQSHFCFFLFFFFLQA